jgi:hypothetical protein
MTGVRVLVAAASVAILAAGCAARGGGGEASAASSADPVTPVSRMLGAGPCDHACPEVAADGSSGFDAVWADDTAVMTAHWSAATQLWSAPTPLSKTVPGQTIPEVAGSASGAAAAIWSVQTSVGPDPIQASYRSADGGAWQPAVTFFSSRAESVSIPDVGIDARGDAFAAWDTDRGVHLAEYPAGGSAWSRPVIVRRAGLGVQGFAVSPEGTLVLSWEHHLSGGNSPNSPSRDLLYIKVRPAGSATWLSTQSLGQANLYGLQGDGPPGTYLPGPRMAINDAGSVFVTWQCLHRGNFYTRAAILSAARRWRPRIVRLPGPGLNPSIAGDNQGVATVLWDAVADHPESAYVREAEVSARGRVLAVRKLGPGAESVIAADGAGDVVAAWSGYGAALRPAGQRWCPRLKLGATREVAVAIAPSGAAQLVWHYGSNNSTNTAMMATTLTPCRP